MLVKRKAIRDKDKYLSYTDLREYVRLKNIKTKEQYISHLSSNYEYDGYQIPYNPSTFYTKDVWEGWSIFLRDEIFKKNYNGTYYTYQECKESIRRYNFFSKSDFINRIKYIIKQDIRIPYSPVTIYKTEWEGWVEFLNTDNIVYQISELSTFEDARDWARKLNLKLSTQWYNIKFEDMPKGMTKKPNVLYKDKGWIDWCDFLGIDKKTKMSYGEVLISDYLDSKNIKYDYNKSLRDCISSSKLRFDFYLPDYNTCVEFDGIQHFLPNALFGGSKEFEKTKIRDRIKNDWCFVNDINLIRFNYKQSNIEILETIEKLISIN